jgi:antitoxin FitA
MPSVQIKNVPDDVHRVLRQRADRAGQSLQEYMLAQLVDFARNPTQEEIFDRINRRSGGRITAAWAAKVIRDEREARERRL